MRWDIETFGALYTALWAILFFLVGGIFAWMIVRAALQLIF